MSKSLAISYAMKKKGQKMADGGPVTIDPDKAKQFIKGFTTVKEHDDACPSCGYAKGGRVLSPADEGIQAARQDNKPEIKGVHKEEGAFGNPYRAPQPIRHAIKEHARVHKESMSIKPKLKGLSDGGLVDRIMAKRMSKGGVASNEETVCADEMPNEFDDLVLDDNLESDYGDDNNSGDSLGNAQEDEDRSDIVSKILSSRRKKDRNPRPA